MRKSMVGLRPLHRAVYPHIGAGARTLSHLSSMRSVHDVYKRKCKQRRNEDRLQALKDLEEHEAKAAASGLPWRIMTSVVIERLPVVLPEPEPWEKEWAEVQDKLAPYGKEYPAQYGMMEEGRTNVSEAELLDLARRAGFEPAPRVTPADEAGDMRSPERALASSLFLLVELAKRRPGPLATWGFPLGLVRPGETMRQGAERVAAEQLGQRMDLFWLSHAPEGWLVYPFPEATQKKAKAYGEKVWFYRAELLGGAPAPHPRLRDHAWLTRAELRTRLPADVAGYLNEILL
mmetsp:Transcript_46557/g.77290  ORF Transcript_46557/g.77290 Transcript_46557/m.77290 type:complete len:290 (+) Transcript_46557:20-889(+)